MLCSLLNSHPQCVCHHELFNPKGIRLALDLREQPLTLPTLEQRDAQPIEFLDHLLNTFQGRISTGFKMTGTQNKTVFDYLLNTPSIKKVLLKRQNTLKELVSHKIADQLNQWEVYDAKQLITNRPKVAISVKELDRRAQQNRLFFAQVEQHLAKSNQHFHQCNYETINHSDAQNPLLDYLNLEHHTVLKTQSVKQNSSELAQLLSNYSELEQQLRKTEFEWQLRA